MTATPMLVAPPDAGAHPEVARLLRDLRLLRDDFRQELRDLADLRESLEDAVDRVGDAWIKLELAREDLAKAKAEDAAP